MNKTERIEKLACKLCDLGNRDRPEECDIHRKPTDDVCSWIFDAKELLSFLESTLGCVWLSDDQTFDPFANRKPTSVWGTKTDETIRGTEMQNGQKVTLRAYGGEELVRRVVRVEKDIVVVCRSEEYEKAKLEGREPLAVGFHIKDVVSKGND